MLKIDSKNYHVWSHRYVCACVYVLCFVDVCGERESEVERKCKMRWFGFVRSIHPLMQAYHTYYVRTYSQYSHIHTHTHTHTHTQAMGIKDV